MKYAPRNCMKCGGKSKSKMKYQEGGFSNECPPGMVYNPQTAQCEVPNMGGETQYFQTGQNEYGRAKGYNPMDATYGEAAQAEQFTTTNPTIPKSKTSIPSKKIDPYFALMGAQSGLSWLSNLMDRKRQNQYMYNQLSTLGQMNPMPVEDFQPNPYNLYSKYGGYMGKGGKWIPKNLKEGRCTPAPNPDCPVGSHQYNLAMTFKKHHGFHK